MPQRFSKLTKEAMKRLAPGGRIIEHGIEYEKLPTGDGRYSINVMVGGKRIRRRIGRQTDGVTLTDAVELIEQLKTDERHGRLKLPKGRKLPMSFKEAAAKYETRQAETNAKNITQKKQKLKDHLVPFFGDRPLSQISTFDVERYIKHRKVSEPAPGTINRELAVLSHLLNCAVDWKWIDNRPCVIKRLPENKGRITYLTIEQVNRLLEEAKKDDCFAVYPFIKIGVATSMRRMEILNIELKNIDLDKRVIYIPQAKSGAREQPMPASLVEFLRPYVKNAKASQKWLFPSKVSKTGHVVNIEKPFQRVVKAAGLNPAVVVRHTLRHTAITHLVQQGVDLPTVKRISGHKTLSMVERYSHQSGNHIQAAMDKLDACYAVQPAKPKARKKRKA